MTEVLKAMGSGGLIGGLISALFVGWGGIAFGLAVFVTTAIVAAVLEVREERKR